MSGVPGWRRQLEEDGDRRNTEPLIVDCERLCPGQLAELMSFEASVSFLGRFAPLICHLAMLFLLPHILSGRVNGLMLFLVMYVLTASERTRP